MNAALNDAIASLVSGMIKAVGVDGVLRTVFAQTGAERARAILDAEYQASEVALDALEDEKFGKGEG